MQQDAIRETLGLQRFDSRGALEARLCAEIAEALRQGVQQRGAASLVVSGGRTPVALFEALSREALDWSRVVVTLADERWVVADSDDSNERLVRQHLLREHAAQATFIPLKNAQASAAAGMPACESALQRLPETLDAVILGMGEDGHTASFFPGAAALAAALDPVSGRSCQAITPLAAPHERMTLTLPRLLKSRRIYLHLCGDGKLPVLEQAVATGPVEAMPVRAVLRQTQTPLAVFWAP